MALVKHMYVFAALCFHFHVIYFVFLTTNASGYQIPVTTAGPTKKSGGKPVKTTTTLPEIRAVPTDKPRTTASIATKKKGKPPPPTTTTLFGMKAVPSDKPRTTASIATKKKGKPPPPTTTTVATTAGRAPAVAYDIPTGVYSEYSTTTEGARAPRVAYDIPTGVYSEYSTTTEGAIAPAIAMTGFSEYSTTTEGAIAPPTTAPDIEIIVPGPATQSTTGSLTTSTTERTTTPNVEMIVPGPATKSTTGSLTTSTTESSTIADVEMIVPGPATQSTTGSLTTSTTESTTTPNVEMIVPGPATQSTTGSLTTLTTERTTTPNVEMIVPGPATQSTTGSLMFANNLRTGVYSEYSTTTEGVIAPPTTAPDIEMIVPGPATQSTTGSLTTLTTGSGTMSTTGAGTMSTTVSGTPSTTGSSTTSTTGSSTMSTTESGTTSTTTAVTTSTTTVASSSGLEHHQLGSLLQNVLAGYDRRIRPRKDQSRFVSIFSDFVPFSIIEFDTQEQKFVVMGYFKMDWRDAFLKWNSDNYEGTKTLRIPVQSMWIPKLVIDKSVDDNGGIVGDMKTDIAMVSRKGYIRWFPEGIYAVSCLVTIRFYPFDVQSCTFSYYIADEDNSTVNLKHDGEVDLSEYIENAEWKLLNVTATRELVNSNYVVHFRFDVERRGGFAMFTLVVPLLMLSMLSGATFLIPIETGEKCSFSVTLFLAYGIFETIVIDTLPHNSLDVSYFILYITALLVISVVLTFYTILQAKIFDAIGEKEFGGCKRSNPGAETDAHQLTWGTFLRKLDTFVFVGFLLVFGGVSSLFAFAMGEKFDFV